MARTKKTVKKDDLLVAIDDYVITCGGKPIQGSARRSLKLAIECRITREVNRAITTERLMDGMKSVVNTLCSSVVQGTKVYPRSSVVQGTKVYPRIICPQCHSTRSTIGRWYEIHSGFPATCDLCGRHVDAPYFIKG
jgi:hypothetical protein